MCVSVRYIACYNTYMCRGQSTTLRGSVLSIVGAGGQGRHFLSAEASFLFNLFYFMNMNI